MTDGEWLPGQVGKLHQTQLQPQLQLQVQHQPQQLLPHHHHHARGRMTLAGRHHILELGRQLPTTAQAGGGPREREAKPPLASGARRTRAHQEEGQDCPQHQGLHLHHHLQEGEGLQGVPRGKESVSPTQGLQAQDTLGGRKDCHRGSSTAPSQV